MQPWEIQIDKVLRKSGYTLEMLPKKYGAAARKEMMDRQYEWRKEMEEGTTLPYNSADFLCHMAAIIKMLATALVEERNTNGHGKKSKVKGANRKTAGRNRTPAGDD